ncbi:SdpI family protein [Isachenkonia alkalipeptolytica]|uniref:SdpI family protein n=1 Tax=Isachenkonia alkalipeptolytica TaxID=2565777 RepID=A0AA44BD13_9CLOT|nr:SdpI family protein [Isachenkonia alkalipeptolytica]NBG87492.1 SdpI family protein [Isachenkonia alkalipeptolytica]
MERGQIIFDFVIPILLIIFGAYFERNPVKKGAVIFGHRTRRSKQSEEAWDYANRRMGPLWKKWGAILFVIIALSYVINPLAGRDLNYLHFILGVIFVFIPTFIIEGELKRQFGDPDREQKPVQGLRDNKKVKKQKKSDKKKSNNKSNNKSSKK